MQLLNKDLDDSTIFYSQLSNYKTLNNDLEEFDKLLTKLEKNYSHNKELHIYFKNIINLFTSKSESVDSFKSLNASLISGSAFLFDLQRNITNADNIAYKTKSLVNEIMFYLFEFHSSQNIDKSFIEKKLIGLKSSGVIKSNHLLRNFYKQSKVLLDTMESLNKISQEIQKNKLTKRLSALQSILTQEYKSNIYQEKVIVIFTFISMILIWMVLILLYLHSHKNEKVLQQLASVFANTQEAIVITSPDGHIVSVNRAFSDIYGYRLSEIQGKTFNFLHSGMHDKLFYQDLWSQIRDNGIYQGRIINKTKDDQNIPMWITIKPVYDQSENVINYIGVQTDLRGLEASNKRAEYLAYHDTLTGLYNRVSFEELLEHALLGAQRDTAKFAVLFIDLDRFKIINDTLGHDIGDRVLVEAATRLQVALRKSDVVSRWGGDEFVIILEHVVSESLVASVAQKIINIMKEPIHVDEHMLNVTASVGIALYPEDAQDAPTLIKYADSAMYQAKDNGKNDFSFYTPALSAEIEERLEIDIALKNSLQKNEIYLVFQPQYRLKDKKIVAVEALVRWENDTLGFIPPDKFIPIAEENGFIIPLGSFIFEEACKKYKQMKDSGVPLERIAINVSTNQFRQVKLVDEFVAILTRYKLQSSEIEIEITERFFMEDTEKNINILQEFRKYGFTISIDDFGTGYSSISYLKRLPINTLKIDKSFVDDIGLGDSQDDAIVDAIVALSKTLDYTIIAEGIETKVQEDFLNHKGCDIGQGYIFSKPLTLEDLIRNFAQDKS